MEPKSFYKTAYWDVRENDRLPFIQEAARWLQAREPVAFPTETVYGLGADACCDEAVQKIFTAKGRPADNPLIVHVSKRQQLWSWGVAENRSVEAEKLMTAFWPGPLTLILPKGSAVAETVTAGLTTVAVRMPDHPVASALIEESGMPLAAPSANRSGRPSPTRADHVWDDLHGRIAGVLDGGETGIGVESTVLDISGDAPTILRPGGITQEMLKAKGVDARLDPGLLRSQQTPKSPGMKYRHYAPKGELWLVEGEPERMRKEIQKRAYAARLEGKNVGILTASEFLDGYEADQVLSCGSVLDPSSTAKRLYQVLRTFDQAGVDVILSESFSRDKVGAAVMNRLEKAAGGKVIRV